jgi:hypothetical protein
MLTPKIDQVIKYLRKELGIDNNLNIIITFESSFDGGVLQHDINNYEIYLNPNLEERELLDAIAHEVRHVWQLSTKRLVYTGHHQYLWEDELEYKHSHYEIGKHPHEIDANNFMRQVRSELS